MHPLITIAKIITAIFLLSLSVLRAVITSVTDKNADWMDKYANGKIGFLAFIIPMRFGLYDEYPDKKTLKLSRIYDKLIVVWFMALIGWAVGYILNAILQ